MIITSCYTLIVHILLREVKSYLQNTISKEMCTKCANCISGGVTRFFLVYMFLRLLLFKMKIASTYYFACWIIWEYGRGVL